MLKTLTTCYAIFLILVVLLADAGYLSSLMAWLHYLPAGDKLCHFLLVGGLSFLVTASWSWHHPRYRYRLAVMTIVAISAVTCLEECSQSMLSHRRYDPGGHGLQYCRILVFRTERAPVAGQATRARACMKTLCPPP